MYRMYSVCPHTVTCQLTLALSGVSSLGSDPGLAHACELMGLWTLGTPVAPWLRVTPET